MPVYIYQNPKTRQVKEILQSIHDKHEYYEDGILWDRVFTSPQVNTQEKLSVNSNEKDFARVTKDQKGTVGDLWERSQELSEKRKKVYGKDPIKKKYFENWSKKRKGKVHPKSHLD